MRSMFNERPKDQQMILEKILVAIMDKNNKILIQTIEEYDEAGIIRTQIPLPANHEYSRFNINNAQSVKIGSDITLKSVRNPKIKKMDKYGKVQFNEDGNEIWESNGWTRSAHDGENNVIFNQFDSDFNHILSRCKEMAENGGKGDRDTYVRSRLAPFFECANMFYFVSTSPIIKKDPSSNFEKSVKKLQNLLNVKEIGLTQMYKKIKERQI